LVSEYDLESASLAQLKGVFAQLTTPDFFEPEEKNQVDQLVNCLDNTRCRMCRECKLCPMGISIWDALGSKICKKTNTIHAIFLILNEIMQ